MAWFEVRHGKLGFPVFHFEENRSDVPCLHLDLASSCDFIHSVLIGSKRDFGQIDLAAHEYISRITKQESSINILTAVAILSGPQYSRFSGDQLDLIASNVDKNAGPGILDTIGIRTLYLMSILKNNPSLVENFRSGRMKEFIPILNNQQHNINIQDEQQWLLEMYSAYNDFQSHPAHEPGYAPFWSICLQSGFDTQIFVRNLNDTSFVIQNSHILYHRSSRDSEKLDKSMSSFWKDPQNIQATLAAEA